MKKPSSRTFVLGHMVTLLVITVVGLLVTYQWSLGLVTGFAPLIMVLIWGASANARQQVLAYRKWKRAWDAMGGQGPEPYNPKRYLLPVAAWLISALALVLNARDPKNILFVILFVFINVVLLARAFFRARKRAPKKRAQEMPVSICLPVPKQAPELQQIFQGLPEYCARM